MTGASVFARQKVRGQKKSLSWAGKLAYKFAALRSHLSLCFATFFQYNRRLLRAKKRVGHALSYIYICICPRTRTLASQFWSYTPKVCFSTAKKYRFLVENRCSYLVFAQKMQAIVFSFSDFLSKILSRRSPLSRTTSDSHPALKMEVLGQKSKSKMRFSVFPAKFLSRHSRFSRTTSDPNPTRHSTTPDRLR